MSSSRDIPGLPGMWRDLAFDSQLPQPLRKRYGCPILRVLCEGWAISRASSDDPMTRCTDPISCRWCIPAEKVSGKWNNYLYLTTAIYLSQIESDAYHTCGCEEIENP